MRKTDYQFTGKKRLSLAEIIAEGGPMEERKAMEIARALCSRLMGEGGLTETDLSSFHPKTILLSSEGTISFSGEAVSESAKEPYLPPEYVKGSTSKETVVIYALGMLLLFLVTGREKKSGMDAMVKNPTLKTVINRCTALDSRSRYPSLTEVGVPPARSKERPSDFRRDTKTDMKPLSRTRRGSGSRTWPFPACTATYPEI